MRKLTNKQIDKEIALELENEFTKKDLIKLLVGFNRNHIDLTKWLYDNHLEILREYEKSKGDTKIYFVGGKNVRKKEKR
jgi:hypothetical protein